MYLCQVKNGLVMVVCLFFLASCQKELSDCFKNRGKPVNDKRILQPFSKIFVYDKIDLVLIKDSLHPEHAELAGWKNLISSVSVEVKNGVLTIHDNNTCNFVRDLNNRTTVTVYFHDLTYLETHDYTTVKTIQRLNLDTLTLWDQSMGDIDMGLNIRKVVTTTQQSGGNITLHGYAAVFITVMDDVGGMDAASLQGDYTYVYQNGTHDCYVQPYKELGVNINYYGNVYYNRTPMHPIMLYTKGSGKLIKQ